MSGPSNRTRTGDAALCALARIIAMPDTGCDVSASWIVGQLDKAGFIIVPKPYKQPADRGGAAKQIAKRNRMNERALADAMCSGSGR